MITMCPPEYVCISTDSKSNTKHQHLITPIYDLINSIHLFPSFIQSSSNGLSDFVSDDIFFISFDLVAEITKQIDFRHGP